MPNDMILAAFQLGLKTAEQIHGVTMRGSQALADEMRKTLERVASGEITLLDTPEEIAKSLPPPPDDAEIPSEVVNQYQEQLMAEYRAGLNERVRTLRAIAKELLKMIP